MAAVTQKVRSYLGGVSQQPEELMIPGQVLDAQNVYIDPALGLTKRSALEYVGDLTSTAGYPVIPTFPFNDYYLTQGKWFPIFLTPTARFFCCVGPNTVRVFGTDGIERAVATPSGTSYLSSITSHIDVATLTVNESTFIANKKTEVLPKAWLSTWEAGKVATVVITEVHYGAQYSIVFRLNGVNTTITYTTFNTEAAITTPGQTERTVTAGAILTGLQGLLPAGYSGTIVGNTMNIVRTTGTLTFTATATGAISRTGMYVFQDEISDVGDLPGKAVHDRLVKIANAPDIREDDYWLKFTAWNSISGDGYWTEWIAPYANPGIQASTAPHRLTYNATTDSFTFEPIPWIDRLVGDGTTNPNPSFINKRVKAMFFHSNRFGILTDESIVMSQTNDFFNFFAGSVLATVDTDPVDRTVPSVTPIELYAVHATKQGLLLFSDNEQFLAEGVDGIFSPSTTSITSISNFECDLDVDPVDLGTTIGFVSKSRGWTRLFEMLSRGQNEQPEIADLTRIVPEWIPQNINMLTASPQAGMFVMGVKSEIYSTASTLYVLKYWQDGQSRDQAWTKWTLPEGPLMLYIHGEQLWVVTNGYRFDGQTGAPRLCLCTIDLSNRVNSSSSSYSFTASRDPLEPISILNKTDPKLDYLTVCNDLVWDSSYPGGRTKVYFPARYTPIAPLSLGTTNALVVTNPSGGDGADVFRTLVPVLYETSGAFAGRYYTTVDGENLTTLSLSGGKKIVYGLQYNCSVELPRIFFRTGQDYTESDTTASLTINRMKFMCGITGSLELYLRTRGRADWKKVEAIPMANMYIEGSVPIINSKMFTLPIHQKAENFSVRIDSPSVYPFTLISSTWEGNYVPRFYRRT